MAANTTNKLWLTEIQTASRRENDFRKDGRNILKIYNGDRKDEIPFNILYSNTETMLPATYNSTPRPVVQRRFKDDDPLGKLAAQAAQRGAEFLLDTNSEEYPAFDTVMSDAVLDALLPGRGVTLVKYDAHIQEAADETAIPIVKWELVCFESIPWDRVRFGYAKSWKKVPWMAIYYEVDQQEAVQVFGEEVAGKMKFSPRGKDEEGDREESDEGNKDKSDIKVCPIWHVWDKKKKEILWVSDAVDDSLDVLKREDDELNLQGFFPIAEPLRFVRKANNQMPTALYKLYENQARELNRITVRLNKIIGAMKVRGLYNSALQEVEDILKQDDGVMLPAQNAAALESGNLNTALWLVPVEKLIPIVNELLAARQQCKQTIYEITGISDILRGQTNAQETLGAQKIKENWATLRLKRVQRDVQRYARDLIRITIEIAAAKLGEDTWKGMTGLPFPTTQEKQKMVLQAQAQAQQAAAMGQPPEQIQAQMQQIMNTPSWGDVLAALRDDTQRNYRIDIETNSTVDLEATEDQKNISDVMNAMAQFLSGVGPLVQEGIMPFQAAQAMLLGIVRRYRFGSEIEDIIKQMQPPQPKADPKAQLDLQKAQMDHDTAVEQNKMDREASAQEHGQKMAEMKQKGELAMLQGRIAIMKANKQMQVMSVQAQTKEPSNAPA